MNTTVLEPSEVIVPNQLSFRGYPSPWALTEEKMRKLRAERFTRYKDKPELFKKRYDKCKKESNRRIMSMRNARTSNYVIDVD